MTGGQSPDELLAGVPFEARPRHIAIIMDGNGRWAKARGVPRKVGHEQGVEAVRRTVRAAGDFGLKYLTLYGFSSENWQRSPEEINDLMGLLRFFIKRDLKDLVERGVRIRIIGSREHLAPDIIDLINDAEAKSAHNDAHFLNVAFNYGARWEITEAARALAAKAAAGELKAEDIDEDMLAAHLGTHGQPDPDLLIRTSGEQRISNFLLWQAAYAELLFDDVLWPDFDKAHLAHAIAEFARRDRRFGGRPDEPPLKGTATS